VAVLDAWSADGETVLLLDGRILLLSALAAVAWHAMTAGAWTPVEALAAVLVDCFGEPEDPEAAMAAVVAELSAAGLVEVAP
jgi:hypothetical protein